MVKLLCFLHKNVVHWIAVLQSSCGEALALHVQGLCCLSKAFHSVLMFYNLFVVKLSHFLHEACVVVMLLCCLCKALHS